MTGLQQVDDAVIAEASRSLIEPVPDPLAMHWRYGVWDAPFVAEHGWRPFPAGPPGMMWLDTDSQTADRCAKTEAVLSLGFIDPSVSDEETASLGQGEVDSSQRSMADPEYRAVMDEFETCLREAGLAVERDEELPGPAFSETASEEELLAGMLKEAACSDERQITQRAGDIEARYQVEYIQEHEAELIAIKRIADERVRKAREILAEVGVE
ncbi:MAG: hypothetical protein ACK5LN_07010 [Propioniciclava sp.]